MDSKINSLNSYEDIIGLPHHVSLSHPPMAIIDRAAQFAPFAALTGHNAAIKEKARLTNQKMELDENCKEILNEKLSMIMAKSEEKPVIRITYFEPDSKKNGGSYVTVEGIMKKVDRYENRIILVDGIQIPIEDIIDIDETN